MLPVAALFLGVPHAEPRRPILRYTAQGQRAPDANIILDMVTGAQPSLPWWIPNATASHATASAVRGLTAQFCTSFREWNAAQEELAILSREARDVLRCCVDHLKIAGDRGDALQLPLDAPPFTSLESDISYLKRFVRNTVSLHMRTVPVAKSCGAELVPIPDDVLRKLIGQRLYNPAEADSLGYYSLARGQTYDEFFSEPQDVEETDEEE